MELKDNPYSQSQAIRQERLDKLLAENAALLSRSASPTVPAASLQRAEFDIAQAKKDAEESSKRLDRLKRVFGEQAGVLRECVLRVLGWKLDADPTAGRITLRSTYSAHESHCFYFKSAPGKPDNLQFMGSGSPEFLAKIDPQVVYYLTTGGSLAGLLAWVTLEGFKRTTGAPGMLPTDEEGDEEGRKRRRT